MDLVLVTTPRKQGITLIIPQTNQSTRKENNTVFRIINTPQWFFYRVAH